MNEFDASPQRSIALSAGNGPVTPQILRNNRVACLLLGLTLGFVGYKIRSREPESPLTRMPVATLRTKVGEMKPGEVAWISPTTVEMDYDHYVWVKWGALCSRNWATNESNSAEDYIVKVTKIDDGTCELVLPTTWKWTSEYVDDFRHVWASKVTNYTPNKKP